MLQGLETEGILDMVKAREATGMPIVSEQMCIRDRLNIALIGMPSSGKSTLGRALAERLGKDVYKRQLQDEHLITQRELVAHGIQAVQQAVGAAFSLAATASSERPECFAAMVISSLS